MFDDTTMGNIRILARQKETEEKYQDPEIPGKLDSNDWPNTMDSLEEYLRGFCGMNGVTLSYVPRREIMPSVKEDDPPTRYSLLDTKRITGAPIVASTENTTILEAGTFV